MLRPAAALALLALASCAEARPAAHPRPAPVDPSEGAEPTATGPVDVAALERDVARVRHLDLRAPVPAHGLDPAAFRARLESTSFAAKSSGASTSAFWYGFGFAPPASPIGETTRRVLGEQVVGFYDAQAKELFLRGAKTDGARVVLGSGNDREILVHEIEHALQDQAFGMDAADISNDDAALARRALYEGDAVLTELAYEASRDATTEHWVSRVTRHLRATSLEQLVRAGQSSPELLSAPPLVQRRVLFPYLNGLTFVADVYRAGGLGLVDQVFARPPTSTEQVLHPQKYVDGDEPIAVPPPAPPAGTKVVAAGRMGELQTSVLLGQCMPVPRAEESAGGWGGDAYAIVKDEIGQVSLLWSTAWDDDDSAERFERAARARVGCAAHDALVLRLGTRVVYVQGLTEGERDEAARAMLAVPLERKAATPPLGAVVIPPLLVPEEIFGRRGQVGPAGFTSAMLGVTAPVPRGYVAVDVGGDFELLMKRASPSLALAGFSFLMTSATRALETRYLRTFMKGLRGSAAMHDVPTWYVGSTVRRVGGAAATAYEWALPHGGVQVAFAPACKGKATIAVLAVWITEDGRRSADAWADAIRLPADAAPVCAYLEQVVD